MEYLVWHANAPGRNGNVALRKTLKTSWTAKVTNERLLTNANVTQTVRRHQNRKKTFRTRYAQKRTGQSIGKRQRMTHLNIKERPNTVIGNVCVIYDTHMRLAHMLIIIIM